MAKSKTRRHSGDYDLLEKLKHENDSLKKELKKLRKINKMVDVGRFEHLEELVRKQRQERKLHESKEKRKAEKAKAKWLCHKCASGIMQINIWPLRNKVKYNRACSNQECGHKTLFKDYHEGVEDS